MKVVAGVVAVFLFCGAGLAEGAHAYAAQPFELVRSLQSLQDKITTGSKAMRDARPLLLARVAASLKEAPESAWDDPRNARAAVIYLLNGGDRGVVQAIYDDGHLKKCDPDLVQGALAYVGGDFAAAAKYWEHVEAQGLPASLAAHVAFAQAALAFRDTPEKAIKLLDLVRLLAPGTLVEDAALRREILLMQGDDSKARMLGLARQYLSRFDRSLYADEVRSRLLHSLPAVLEKSGHDIAVEHVIEHLPIRAAIQIYLTAAGVAVTHGRTLQAEGWARIVLGVETEPREKSRAWLYVAAARVNRLDRVAGRAALAESIFSDLQGPDVQLFSAVQAVLSINFSPDVQITKPLVPVTVPANLIQHAQDVLTGTDRLLSEQKPRR